VHGARRNNPDQLAVAAQRETDVKQPPRICVSESMQPDLRGTMTDILHDQLPVQGKWPNRVVTGYFNYHAVPTKTVGRWLRSAFFVTELWQHTLQCRNQKGSMTWEQNADDHS
jgi:hypothetical protein